jgi:hypothetical protein
MPTNPSTADPQKPRRRWFQFRLRTLLFAVAIAGISAAIFAFCFATVEEYRAMFSWFLGFAVLGAAGGLLFGRTKLGVVIGLVAGFAMAGFRGL